MTRLLLSCFIFFTLSFCSAQDQYINTLNYQNANQSYADLECTDEYCFALGASVCNNVEACSVLSKYDNNGDLIFLQELSYIDINSRNCMTIIQDSIIVITGLALPAGKGVRTVMFDFDGEILQDRIITKDPLLSREWPVDVLYLEDYYLVAVDENYDQQVRRASIYKIDYDGNLLDHARLAYYWMGEILSLLQLQNGNLFVSQAYIDEGECLFDHEVPNLRNAAIFYEISIDSLQLVRTKDHICHQSISGVGYDCQILPDGEILRTVILRDPSDANIRGAATISYNEEWDVNWEFQYGLLETVWPYSFGVLGNKIIQSKDSEHYYVIAVDRYSVPDEIHHIDQVLQKWTNSNELVWSKIIKSPNVHKRLLFTQLQENSSGIVLGGSVWRDIEDLRTQSFAIMSLDHDGCYNGNCNDTIYLDGGPVSVTDLTDDNAINIYPNPSSGYINVEIESNLQSISIFDNNGKEVKSQKLNGRKSQIDVSMLASGLYIARVYADDKVYNRKILLLD